MLEKREGVGVYVLVGRGDEGRLRESGESTCVEEVDGLVEGGYGEDM